MSRLSRILVPIDFPPAVSLAMEHATSIAMRADCELHVLHVQVFSRDRYGWAAIPNVADIEKMIDDASRRDLDKVTAAIPHPVVDEIIRDTREAPAILRYARARDIDLIVMGTHARKGVGRLFLGSVTAEVLRHAPVSVMAIGPQHVLPPDGYRRILAAVDFSVSSGEALRQASAIAEQHDAELTVMHAVELPVSVPYDARVESTGEIHGRAVKALDEFVAGLDLPRTPKERIIVVGPADDEIASHANEHAVDLIVMGTVGRSGLGRLLLGSNTERVLRKAPCAVLAHRGAVLENL